MSGDQQSLVNAYVSLVRTAEAIHGDVSRGLAIHGISASKFSALKALKKYGRLAQKDIASKILKSGGNIAIIVEQMEIDGWVERVRDDVDRRIVYVSLSKKGEELFDSLYPDHLDRIVQAMRGLSADQAEQLSHLLSIINGTSLSSCVNR